ncbi:hypothetical protein OXPF_39400 [Oxobacter pfennigii]|uniref:Uncharacterized protein n=1 Tax=Oxobacter pfennigii TaxID=36849 RepID=A0A0P8W3K5_9CLOT|nr:hypothetical protein [Oxobacter pfennigii]KPU42161.1 hypothetical protein OXPF_39400 [Oxobacter pfennigii]
MADIFVLEAIQKFLQDNVTSKFKLQQKTNNINNYALITPSVHIGWIPPKLPEGWTTEEQVPDIPCAIIGMDEGEDSGDEAGINIRITFVVYSPGLHEPKESGGLKFTPDFIGYEDLLNFINRTKLEIARKQIIGITTLQGPFKWGMYQEQPYPYWYGWLTFRARTKPSQYVPGIIDQYL